MIFLTTTAYLKWEETGAFNETLKNAAEDVASSVDWIRENADKYSINPDYIALAGYSSGAEIVDNMYFSNSLIDETKFNKDGIKAVISISGNRLFLTAPPVPVMKIQNV